MSVNICVYGNSSASLWEYIDVFDIQCFCVTCNYLTSIEQFWRWFLVYYEQLKEMKGKPWTVDSKAFASVSICVYSNLLIYWCVYYQWSLHCKSFKAMHLFLIRWPVPRTFQCKMIMALRCRQRKSPIKWIMTNVLFINIFKHLVSWEPFLEFL